MFKRIIDAPGQSGSARSVEIFGWVIFLEGVIILFCPDFVAKVLAFPEYQEQGRNFFRLAGLLVSGLGSLYIVSGRLNSKGFVFASLLDRPLVPPIMLVLWLLEILPGTLALAFVIQDGTGFIWTLVKWRQENDE